MESKKTGKPYGFQPGVSGNPNGRPKGAVSAYTNVRKRLKELDFDPLDELIKFAKHSPKESIRYAATCEIATYAMPKLKAVEMEVKVSAHESALDMLE